MVYRRSRSRSAIEDIGSSIWVSASAGSGKTTILMRRLLCLILNGVEISRMVCITYTRTGAQEIKERTYNSLSRLAIMAEEEFLGEMEKIVGKGNLTQELLRRARNLFAESIDHIDDLRIFTIHSFCQQLISRFPLEARIPHNFEIIDEYQSSDLIRESLEDLLQSSDPGSEVHHHLRLLVIEKNEDELYSFISHLVSKRKKFEFLGDLDYRQDLKAVFGLESSDPEKIISSFLNYDYSGILAVYEKFIESDPSEKNEENLRIVRDLVGNGGENSRKAYLNIFLTKEYEKRDLKRIMGTKKFADIRESLEDIFVEEQERCRNFVQSLENARCYEMTVAMIDVAQKVIGNYGKLKRKKGFLDFDDLIIIALELLQNTEYSAWIGYKLDGEIEHILLDEAQDTSTLQWEIVGSLANEFFSGEMDVSKPRSLFVVGDEKQSIFSFQGANPKMFNEKYVFYRDLLESTGNSLHRLDLHYSFRSVSTILEFVDEVFRDRDILNKISVLSSSLEHHSTRTGVGLVELWPLVRARSIEKEAWKINFANEEDVKKQEILAKLIVDKIVNLVGSCRMIVGRNGENRKIGYGDILILVRNRNHIFLSYLLRHFNQRGIPNSGLDRLNLFEHILIEDFISLFTFIIFQNDDLSLANIIKSPFLDMTEEDLFRVCRYRIENSLSLFEALEKTHEEKYRFLERIIEKSRHLGVYELCFYILEDCGVRAKISSRFSPDTNDILNKFLLLVRQYEGNNNSFLLGFIYFINDRRNEIKKDPEASTDQVRIMTIHASKGLQAPIVFVADINSTVDQTREEILWVKSSAGHEIPIYMTSGHSDILETLKGLSIEELQAEYLRLFYVAITRAENELYLCGLAGRPSTDEGEGEDRVNSWYTMARRALASLNAEEKEVDLGGGEHGKKLIYGRESLGERREIAVCSNDSPEKASRIEKILSSIEKYSPVLEPKKVISPSQFFSYHDRSDSPALGRTPILKGKAVHRLLEILPKIDPNHWNDISEAYVNSALSDLPSIARAEVKKVALGIMRDNNFQKFFSENSRAEVSILGEVDGLEVSGKIDRLTEFDNKIVILDYKNTPRKFNSADELPQEYVKQLELYRKLMEKLNPTKTIECYILMTVHGTMLRVF